MSEIAEIVDSLEKNIFKILIVLYEMQNPSRNGRENPFFNCHGFKPVAIEKRFGMMARLASKKRNCL